jgi:hypothetical protein
MFIFDNVCYDPELCFHAIIKPQLSRFKHTYNTYYNGISLTQASEGSGSKA